MSIPSTSARLILDAASRAIGQRGPEKLTMSAVASAAGVSRPTLYKWFPTKESLLAALSTYEVEQFERGLQEIALTRQSAARRLDAALRYIVTYLDERMGPDSVRAAPAVALQSLADSLESQAESLARQLDIALDQVPAVDSGALSREQAAEMFLRLAYSHYLVPHGNPEELLVSIRAFAGLPKARARRGRAERKSKNNTR